MCLGRFGTWGGVVRRVGSGAELWEVVGRVGRVWQGVGKCGKCSDCNHIVLEATIGLKEW